jgi:hypothetical protein
MLFRLFILLFCYLWAERLAGILTCVKNMNVLKFHITSDSPRIGTGAILILKCFSSILYMLYIFKLSS